MQVLQVNVSDIVFTPITCVSLISEIIKGLLFEKNQIPFPYERLKAVVEKRRKLPKQFETSSKRNFAVESHYRIVSLVHDNLEKINESILQGFSRADDFVREVLIVFGDTPHCAKEIFTINICSIDKGHVEKNHVKDMRKGLQKILRNIFLNEENVFGSRLNCTNTYVFIKKDTLETCEDRVGEAFLLCKPFNIPPRSLQIKIDLINTSDKTNNCCNDLVVFGDQGNNQVNNIFNPNTGSPEMDISWYQSIYSIKGFKDCYVDKVSACDLW